MKLSEAMRKGAAVSKPTKEAFLDSRDRTACALGAALIGVLGWKQAGNGYPINMLEDTFPELCGDGDVLWDEIMARNDERGEARESIADWLESKGL